MPLFILYQPNQRLGIYHFSNEGVVSWYDFAIAIFELGDKKTKVNAIPATEYPLPAKRPHYSVLDKTKIKKLGVKVPYWKDSLKLFFKTAFSPS